jgi:DNA modification methylase
MSKETIFELRNVDDLIPYARNARTHSPEQVNKLASSIKEFGFLNPVVISEDGGVLAGHGRLMAAKKLGLKQVPCVVESHLNESQKKAYILADNRLALDAGWDEEMLKIELEELDSDNFDMGLLGFNADELNKYFDMEPLESDSDNEEEKEVEIDNESKPVTKLGDVWILGNHRLICGDCTDADVVKKVMNGEKPNLMVTDPPYGVNYETTRRAYSKNRMGRVENDDRSDWKEAYLLFTGDIAYIWHASLFSDVVISNIRDCGFKLNSIIVWNKDMFALGRADYQWKHELCVYATRGNHNWKGGRKQSTVWDIPQIRNIKDEGAWGHSTQKPIECMKRPIENNSDKGDWVYDPFCGSGTTIIAAERTGRKCMACEISPIYCDAIVRRWESETGGSAVLEGSGETFDSLSGA